MAVCIYVCWVGQTVTMHSKTLFAWLEMHFASPGNTLKRVDYVCKYVYVCILKRDAFQESCLALRPTKIYFITFRHIC